MYKIRFDEASGILICNNGGFWTIETAACFFDDLNTAILEALKRSGQARLLIDNSDFPVQSQEVIELMAERTERMGALRARTAIVMTRALAKIQAKRIINNPDVAIFEDSGAAKAWLLSTPATD